MPLEEPQLKTPTIYVLLPSEVKIADPLDPGSVVPEIQSTQYPFDRPLGHEAVVPLIVPCDPQIRLQGRWRATAWMMKPQKTDALVPSVFALQPANPTAAGAFARNRTSVESFTGLVAIRSAPPVVRIQSLRNVPLLQELVW